MVLQSLTGAQTLEHNDRHVAAERALADEDRRATAERRVRSATE